MNLKQVVVSFGLVAATLLSPAGATIARAGESPATCVALVQDVSSSMTPKWGDETYDLPVSLSPLDLMHEYPMAVMATAAAIESPEVVQEIYDGGSIGVFYMEFASGPAMRIPYTVISQENAKADAHNFAEHLRSLKRETRGMTAIGLGIRAATEELMTHCPAASQKKIIDIVGDGHNNEGEDSSTARDAAADLHITINGLAFDNPVMHEKPLTGVTYRKDVITSDGFVLDVTSPDQFEQAMKQKLQREFVHNTLPTHKPVRYAYANGNALIGTRRFSVS